MSPTTPSDHSLPKQIRSKIDRLRFSIRAYVWLEGLSLALIWLGLLFWVGLIIDYGPVMLFGASEMPYAARLVFLAIVGAGLAFIFYRFVARRAFIPLHSKSMAVLLERKHGQFHDSLLTVIEMAEHGAEENPFSDEMLDHTYHEALEVIDSVEVGRVFNFRPLAIKAVGAGTLLLSIGLLALLNTDLLQTYLARMSLGDSLYARKTAIEVVGLYEGGFKRVKVAEGKGIAIIIRADNTMHVPQRCRIDFRTADGSHGHVYAEAFDAGDQTEEAAALGETSALDTYKYYKCEQLPFSGVISDIEFDVRGGDHRIRDYIVDVVKNPKIIDAQLYSEFPDYLVDEASGTFTPRDIQITPGTELPRGSDAILMVVANKDLKYVTVENVESGETTYLYCPQQLAAMEDDLTEEAKAEHRFLESWLAKEGAWLAESPEKRRFYFPLSRIDKPVSLKITLQDSDGITSPSPHTILIGSVEDSAPTVDAVLRGIQEEVVTANARIPFSVHISDDYEIAESWIDFGVVEGAKEKIILPPSDEAEIEPEVNLRDLRLRSEHPIALEPGDQIELVISARDHYDLPSFNSEPHIGSSDRYRFEIVTPDEFLRRMDYRELQLRERFEQAIDKMKLSREMLLKVRANESTTGGPIEPGDAPEPGDTESSPEEALENQRNRRLARLKQCIQNGRQISEEVHGIAIGFEDIGIEINHNQIHNASDRIKHHQSEIANPLRNVAATMLDDWDSLLAEVEEKFDSSDFSDSDIGPSLAKVDEIVIEMDRILLQMLDLEDFNELVEILRELIENQERLIEDTREYRDNQLLDLLE